MKHSAVGKELTDLVVILCEEIYAKIYIYEGRSICNENSPIYPKVLYLHTS